jgi:hypothetical protein
MESPDTQIREGREMPLWQDNSGKLVIGASHADEEHEQLKRNYEIIEENCMLPLQRRPSLHLPMPYGIPSPPHAQWHIGLSPQTSL